MSEKPQYGQTVNFVITKVLKDFHTPKSHVQYVETLNHGRMMIMDGEVQYSTMDEHRYHYLLTTQTIANKCENILILGGGDGLAARDLVRSSCTKTVTIVDWDPEFVDFCRTLPDCDGSLNHPKVNFVYMDALEFLIKNRVKYDSIIFDLPDPDGDEMVQLYILMLKSALLSLSKNSVITIHTGPASLNEDHESWKFIAQCKYYLSILCRQTQPTFDKVYVPSFSHEWGFITGYVGNAIPRTRLRIEDEVLETFYRI